MEAEIQALETNHTWSMVPLPPGHRPIGCKWVYKIKYNSNDYTETFALVAKLTTLRCLLALASIRGWNLHQMDVQNAFLHGDLTEEVYMQPPPGFRRQGETLFLSAMKIFGFEQSLADYSLFTKISFSVNTLSQFMQEPRKPYLEAVHRILHYLKGSLGQGLLFFPSDNDLGLIGYCDADWGGCITTRRSVTCYCVFLGKALYLLEKQETDHSFQVLR
ncbi:hypothetical protein UlMin_033272 [Ulmus minor]